MPRSSLSVGRVGLVLAGGGARCSYEIGALSVLLPALRGRERPQIIVGTSVGAINAAYLAVRALKSLPPRLPTAGWSCGARSATAAC